MLLAPLKAVLSVRAVGAAAVTGAAPLLLASPSSVIQSAILRSQLLELLLGAAAAAPAAAAMGLPDVVVDGGGAVAPNAEGCRRRIVRLAVFPTIVFGDPTVTSNSWTATLDPPTSCTSVRTSEMRM